MPDIIPLDLPASYWRGRGQQAQRGGNSREAVRLYRTALRKHADSALRRDLAQAYADLMCLSASDRLYLENLAQDAGDTDSLYGLARNRSLAGDERQMADLLDLYLRLAPCGEKADRARDILWQLPRDTARPQRLRRAEARCRQAEDARMQPARSLRLARQSWQRGKTPEAARLLCQLYLGLRQNKKALRYALAACRLAPEDLNARQLLAVAMYENHYPQGCRAALRQAAALCRDLDQLPLFTGCAMSLDAADLAVELLDTWLKKYPASADLMLLQAMALRCVPEGAERADALFAAPKAQTAAVSVAVPEAQIGASFALPSAEQGEAPVMNTDVPPVDAARFAVGAVSSAEVSVENIEVPVVAIAEPAAVSLEQPALSIAEVSAPAVPAISVQTDAAIPAIDVPQTESVSLVYDEKKAPTVEIDVAVPETALPTLSIGIPENRETAPVPYPEIPETPDFSAYYAEITEAIKQEQ